MLSIVLVTHWHIFFLLSSFGYPLASRNLCPYLHSNAADEAPANGNTSFSIDVSSSSPHPVEYNLTAYFVKHFELKLVKR